MTQHVVLQDQLEALSSHQVALHNHLVLFAEHA